MKQVGGETPKKDGTEHLGQHLCSCERQEWLNIDPLKYDNN